MGLVGWHFYLCIMDLIWNYKAEAFCFQLFYCRASTSLYPSLLAPTCHTSPIPDTVQNYYTMSVVWCSNWFAKKVGCSRPCRNRTAGQSKRGSLRQKEEYFGQEKGRPERGLLTRLGQICNETSQTQKTN